ncbi:hypothetical protein C457_15512 [Haloferax prahovense DSM 18310]|uniref:Uncharacterized protein n=1 Tax=Haloferax prahovense (strain DSM 18310 / JCM 13924 / TL6) TaxID=1227461 RepID=M0G5A2_HALPT|nr:hypothetical protein C457_15512 [Haloferax prahovense DSM 18310]
MPYLCFELGGEIRRSFAVGMLLESPAGRVSEQSLTPYQDVQEDWAGDQEQQKQQADEPLEYRLYGEHGSHL